MIFDENDYRYDLYIAYRDIAIYLIIILIAFAALFYLMLYTWNTGDAHMFNLTNESWEYMKNATIGKPTYVLERLNASY